MSIGRQITDGYELCTISSPLLCRLCCDQAGVAERNSVRMVCLSEVVCIKPKASETYVRAGHYPFTDYIIYWGPSALGCTLQAGLNTDWAITPASGVHSHPEGWREVKASKSWALQTDCVADRCDQLYYYPTIMGCNNNQRKLHKHTQCTHPHTIFIIIVHLLLILKNFCQLMKQFNRNRFINFVITRNIIPTP